MRIGILLLLLAATISTAQTKPDETAIRQVLDDEVAAWNKGDAQAFSRSFATDGTFTNILGMFFRGHQAFLDRHTDLLNGIFRRTVLQQEVVSFKFVCPSTAVVETLTSLSGFTAASTLPAAMHVDDKGRLRTRLLQVLVNDGAGWKISAYHNVEVAPGVTTPATPPSTGQAQAATPEEKDRTAISQTVGRIMDAWNNHDAHAFALTFTEDADFTNVAGMQAHGRSNIESFHAPIFATVFKESHQTAQIRGVRFLTPELAAVDVDWQMTGAKMPDGSPRGDRKGLINSMMAKQPDNSWLFEVVHNTELTGRPQLPTPK